MWFLVKINDEYVGIFCITKENTIGINASEGSKRLIVSSIIEFVKGDCQPLAAIPSIRSEIFAINLPQSNKLLAQALDDVGAELA